MKDIISYGCKLNQNGMPDFNQVLSIIVALLIINIGFSSISNAQDKQMLLFKIDSNQYEKLSFNNKGELQSFQNIIVGSIEENDDIYTLSVELYSYTGDGELLDSTKTIYTCKPEERKVLLNVFPFTDYGKGSEIKISLLDTNTFYPAIPDTGWEIGSIEFQLNIDKGLVRFLGGKSNIKMYDRQIVRNDTLQNGRYEMNSKVEVSIYALGIKVKGFSYRVIEIIDPLKGIIRQTYTSDDGSYFTVIMI